MKPSETAREISTFHVPGDAPSGTKEEVCLAALEHLPPALEERITVRADNLDIWTGTPERNGSPEDTIRKT